MSTKANRTPMPMVLTPAGVVASSPTEMFLTSFAFDATTLSKGAPVSIPFEGDDEHRPTIITRDGGYVVAMPKQPRVLLLRDDFSVEISLSIDGVPESTAVSLVETCAGFLSFWLVAEASSHSVLMVPLDKAGAPTRFPLSIDAFATYPSALLTATTSDGKNVLFTNAFDIVEFNGRGDVISHTNPSKIVVAATGSDEGIIALVVDNDAGGRVVLFERGTGQELKSYAELHLDNRLSTGSTLATPGRVYVATSTSGSELERDTVTIATIDCL